MRERRGGEARPRFSVLLPTHNRADVVGFAIASILAQTEPSFELLVVGDGCTDATADVVQSFTDPRVRWFDLLKAPGFGYANRNLVLRQALGELVAFMAHDDIVLPDHLELLGRCFTDPAVEWAYSRPLWVSDDGLIVPFAVDLHRRDELDVFLHDHNSIPASCVVYRRSCHERYGYWPEDLPHSADWAYWRAIVGPSRGANLAYLAQPTALHFRAAWRDARLWGAHPLTLWLETARRGPWPSPLQVAMPEGDLPQAVVSATIERDADRWVPALRGAVGEAFEQLAWRHGIELSLPPAGHVPEPATTQPSPAGGRAGALHASIGRRARRLRLRLLGNPLRGRNVGLDAAWYLALNPDVAAAGVDPLDHYYLFGAAEGRRARADDDDALAAEARDATLPAKDRDAAAASQPTTEPAAESVQPRGGVRLPLPLVTVCIPSYRSAAFIGHTLASVQRQTFTDFCVVLGLEPDEAEQTIAASRSFLADERFGHHVNETTLGYAGNVRALLQQVRTPYFVILPHDDLWHPSHLAVLAERLMARDDASAAFTDVYRFGRAAAVRTTSLPDAGLSERVLGWALDGAEGMPWRGLTRSEVLYRDYPVNEFDGFAVEVEWALHLLSHGVVLHHQEPLYLKRQMSPDAGDSVSRGWGRMHGERLRAALEHHRRAVLAMAEEVPLGRERTAITLALEAAMLLRWVQFTGGRLDFSREQGDRTLQAMRACDALDPSARDAILARFNLAIARYHLRRGDRTAAEGHVRDAVERDPSYGYAALQLAEVLLAAGRPLEAVPFVHRASALAPMMLGLAGVQEQCAKSVSDVSSPATSQTAAGGRTA